MEPVSLVAFGAAISGAAGTFVEKAWDSGEKWLAAHLQNHREQAVERAQTNMGGFLRQLACAVETLEQSGRISKLVIETAQDHPDFSVLLQKAMLTAAQTDDRDKQTILARLVSGRLAAEPESLFSLTSKIACDAISFMNARQLRILGLLATIGVLVPERCPPQEVSEEGLKDWFLAWLEPLWAPYRDLACCDLDLLHLESLSCLQTHPVGRRNLAREINRKIDRQLFEEMDFTKIEVGDHIIDLWHRCYLDKVSLTTTGQLIGLYVSDLLTGRKTSFDAWE